MCNYIFLFLVLFWIAFSIYFEVERRKIIKSLHVQSNRAICLTRKIKRANKLIVLKFDNLFHKLEGSE